MTYFDSKVLSSRVYPEFFALDKNDRVLNLGAGEGPQVQAYRGQFESMACVDVQPARMERMRTIPGVEIVPGNAEKLPFGDASFDKALAIDLIEHVENPDQMMRELRRVLKPGARALVTFPAMHDRFTDAVHAVGRLVGRRERAGPAGWHPDHHARHWTTGQYRAVIRRSGFTILRERATTMFPPLHLYGVPKFWFRSNLIHAIDRRIASIPVIRELGQTIMAEIV